MLTVSPVICVKIDSMRPSLGLCVPLQDGTRFSAACFVVSLLQLEEHQTRFRAQNSQQTVITIMPEGAQGILVVFKARLYFMSWFCFLYLEYILLRRQILEYNQE